MSWPHKEDGTVDWNTVFEDEDVGLEGFIHRAQTAHALGQCAHVIVQSLFIRDQDTKHRDAFNHMIDELIEDCGDDEIDRLRDLMLKLVHGIKDNRIKHAATYLENGGTAEGEHYDRADHDPTEVLEALKEEG